ncbi:MAG: hypothetical protein COB36_11420 [Alphaproteobacteria bacterium]|nr:MAG: hypothetical protein COB36_11420 [Alphaproteobacteria bacterium]
MTNKAELYAQADKVEHGIRPYKHEAWVILNYLGQLWTPHSFQTRFLAEQYHTAFWGQIHYRPSKDTAVTFSKVIFTMTIDEVLRHETGDALRAIGDSNES